jgi:hypothetical protein
MIRRNDMRFQGPRMAWPKSLKIAEISLSVSGLLSSLAGTASELGEYVSRLHGSSFQCILYASEIVRRMASRKGLEPLIPGLGNCGAPIGHESPVLSQGTECADEREEQRLLWSGPDSSARKVREHRKRRIVHNKTNRLSRHRDVSAIRCSSAFGQRSAWALAVEGGFILLVRRRLPMWAMR